MRWWVCAQRLPLEGKLSSEARLMRCQNSTGHLIRPCGAPSPQGEGFGAPYVRIVGAGLPDGPKRKSGTSRTPSPTATARSAPGGAKLSKKKQKNCSHPSALGREQICFRGATQFQRRSALWCAEKMPHASRSRTVFPAAAVPGSSQQAASLSVRRDAAVLRSDQGGEKISCCGD